MCKEVGARGILEAATAAFGERSAESTGHYYVVGILG